METAIKNATYPHSTPNAIAHMVNLNQPGRLRIKHLLALFSVSRASFYNGMKDGRYPKPDGTDGRPYWKTETVRAALER